MSQSNRARWNFITHPAKPALEALEVNYWKTLLSKLIKVGSELEFNLPAVKGLCKQDNPGCGCARLKTHDCWMVCLNTQHCNKVYQDIDHCLNKKATCKAETCKKGCSLFKFNCSSLACSHFIPACADCTNFSLDCNNCKFLHDPEKDPEMIRENMKGLFMPSNCYGNINNSGVHSVKTDGSLLGGKGAEVITIGRRVDFWEFYTMFKNILDNSTKMGAYVNERCSTHMHILTSYYENSLESRGMPSGINELEKPMPEIILTNFHQLMRKYQNAITWMSMGLDKVEHLTRWEKYRVSVLEISPLLSSMRQVAENVKKSSNNSKYGFVDYRFCTFNPEGNVKRFHAEIRVLDALVSPSALAAFACLFHALLIKAVEISRYGVLEMDADWLGQARSLKKHILNGSGDWDSNRLSDTRQTLNNRKYYEEEAIDMVQQLKHILLHTGPAYDVLEKIAKEPLALKRVKGLSWEDIEKELVPDQTAEESDLSRFINEAIDMRVVKRCKDTTDWVKNVSDLAKQEAVALTDIKEIMADINNIIQNKYQNGDAIWSSSLGAVVSIS